MRINIPNQITLGRLGLAVLFFGLLSFYSRQAPATAWILDLCFWVLLIALLTDILDGWLARMWGQVTSFGRVVDPVVDKVIVCGAFLFYASDRFYDPTIRTNATGVAPWMVTLVLTRELLVSAIRSYSEAQGQDFGANWVGKLKMFSQSFAACTVLGVLAWFPNSLGWLRVASVWAMVIITALSIVSYLQRARRFILSAAALGGAREPAADAP